MDALLPPRSHSQSECMDVDSLEFSDYLSMVLLFLYSRFQNSETLFTCQPVSAHTGRMQDFHKQYSLYPEYKWNIIE